MNDEDPLMEAAKPGEYGYHPVADENKELISKNFKIIACSLLTFVLVIIALTVSGPVHPMGNWV